MAGRVIRILHPTILDDVSAANLQPSQSITTTLAEQIDVTNYREATLVVRLHPGSDLGTGGSITVSVVGDGHTEDDPAAHFMTAAFGSVTFSGAGPQVQVLPVKGDGSSNGFFGAMLAIQVTFTQSVGGGNVKPYLSIDISVKE